MPSDTPELHNTTSAATHPSLWLVLPTLALLMGQAAAVSPLALPAEAAGLLVAPLFFFPSRRLRDWAVLALFAGAAFSLGYARHRQLLYPVFPHHHLRSLTDGNTRLYIEGSLRQEPETLPNRSRWILRCERIWHPTGAQEVTGDILLSVRSARRQWRYGDRVRFWVRPLAPRNSGNPGGFNYADYLAGREIYVTGFLESDNEVELLARKPGPVRGGVESLRREIRRFIDQNFSHDNGALMKALVVGDMGGISKEMRADFTAAGVNHVLSISGLHVGMLGLVVFALIRFGCSFSTYLLLCWNLLKVATFFSFFAVAFYTALAGAMVPTVRSAIMIGVYELAVLLDREEEVLTSLTFAALLIAVFWPGVIADISFQLSFVAVLSIAWGIRNVQKWFPAPQRVKLPQERSWIRPKLRQAGLHLAVPILATLGTGPLIAHYFGHLSLAGFIANPVVVPVVGFIVVPLGLFIGFFAVALPEAAFPFVWLAERLLSFTIWLVDWFARFPLANISVPAPNYLEVVGLYLLIFSILLLRRKLYAVVAVVVILLAFAADGVYWWLERWQRKELRVTQLNVGQGDAAVVELPGSKVLLLDAGGSAFADFDTGEAIVAPFLRSRKILKVDFVLVSHPRIDHYGGMRTIVNEFAPSEFWSGLARGKTARFEDLEDALEKLRIKRHSLHDQQSCRIIEQAKLCVLYPGPDNTDDSSVVLRIEFGAVRLLFPGDIDKRDERRLQAKAEELQSAVLKVPRHGSATSSTAEFLAAVKPKLAIFSMGAGGFGRQSRDEVVERYREIGAEILRTDADGAVILVTDGKTLGYEGYKSRKRGRLSF